MRGKAAAKRVFDIGAAALGLAATAPVQVFAALAVRATMGSPVFFRQERPGLDGELFTMLKFRTMLPVDQATGRITDAQRLTKVGQFLRRTSIDELPELWNVLRGDMAIVGPRPLLPEYLALYTPEQARRHDVRPGLTGLAQASGRNSLGWEERFSLDVKYADTWTLRGDLDIMMKTVLAVIRGQGVSAEGSATMPKFEGSPTVQEISK